MAKTPRNQAADATNPGSLTTGAQTIAGPKTFTDGIGFGNETLSVYDEGSFTVYITDGTNNVSSTAYYTKIGKVVTINIPTILRVNSAGTGGFYLTSSATPATNTWPTGLIPNTRSDCPVSIANGAVYGRGFVSINSDGSIPIWAGPAGEGFVAGTSLKGVYFICFTYLL